MVCFCRVGELGMAFIILNDWKKENFKTWKLYDSQISVSIKSSFTETHMLIYLHTVMTACTTVTAEQFNRHYTTYKT